MKAAALIYLVCTLGVLLAILLGPDRKLSVTGWPAFVLLGVWNGCGIALALGALS